MADGRFGCEADMAGPATGSSRSLVTHLRHWLCTAPIVSVPIEVPVSADAMLSSELGNRYAATRVYHAGRGTAAASPLAAHAQPLARSRKVGLLHPAK